MAMRGRGEGEQERKKRERKQREYLGTQTKRTLDTKPKWLVYVGVREAQGLEKFRVGGRARSAEKGQDSHRHWPMQRETGNQVSLDMLNRGLRRRLIEEQCAPFARDKDSDRC